MSWKSGSVEIIGKVFLLGVALAVAYAFVLWVFATGLIK